MTGVRTRILHIVWSGHSGGAERYIRDIVTYSNRDRFAHAVCFLSSGARLAQDLMAMATPVYCLTMKSGFSAHVARLYSVIRTVQPHIVHNHTRNYLATAILSLFRHTAKLYYEHGGDLLGTDAARDTYFYRLFGKQYDAILVNSEFTRSAVRALECVPEQRIRTCYIGVNVEAYGNGSRRKALKEQLGIPARGTVIGTVSRLAMQKGVDDFVKVAAAIRLVRNDCHFVVVGDGDERPTLEHLAASYNLRIHFLGDRADVPELLSIFDIFLYTPRWEPFGIVIVEALAARIPVLGYRVGGVEEIFMKGGGGLLVSGRDVQTLARAVRELLADKRAYRKLSREGYANVKKNFNIRNTIGDLENEYRALAKAYENHAH